MLKRSIKFVITMSFFMVIFFSPVLAKQERGIEKPCPRCGEGVVTAHVSNRKYVGKLRKECIHENSGFLYDYYLVYEITMVESCNKCDKTKTTVTYDYIFSEHQNY